jgi:hypothetical protein
VLVVVVLVWCVAVTVVVIVNMVIVLDGLVATTFTVDVIVVGMNPMLGIHTHLYRLLTRQRPLGTGGYGTSQPPLDCVTAWRTQTSRTSCPVDAGGGGRRTRTPAMESR